MRVDDTVVGTTAQAVDSACLFHLDPYLSRIVLKTRLRADTCSTLLTSHVGWHLVVVHVSDTAVTCEKKSESSNELASKLISARAPLGWAAGGGMKQLRNLRGTCNKVRPPEGWIVDLDRKLKTCTHETKACSGHDDEVETSACCLAFGGTRGLCGSELSGAAVTSAKR